MKRKKTGRPLADINGAQVEKLAGFGCTNIEIADVFGVDEGTVRKRFSENLTRGRANLKFRLRKKQIQRALAGSDRMLIWLGKQELDQREKQELSGPNGASIPVEMKLSEKFLDELAKRFFPKPSGEGS